MPERSRKDFFKVTAAAAVGTIILPNIGFRHVDAQIPQGIGKLDPFTGDFKSPGDEIVLFWSGFISDEGVPYSEIVPIDDTFVKFRQRLLPRFHLRDSFFFTYGVDRIGRYSARDTARDPKINIANAINFFETIDKIFPGRTYHSVAHSLGSNFALAVAMKYPEKFKSLTLINGPVKGLRPTWGARLRAGLLTQPARPFIGEEKVTGYLFDLWENKKYQKELAEFTTKFSKNSRLLSIVSTDDPIVPRESSTLSGGKLVLLPASNVAFSIMIPDYLRQILDAHGRPLREEKIAGEVVKVVS
jgi:hypothetical protein